MPAESKAQRELMAIAEHHPSEVNPKNRGVLNMDHSQLHDFASSKEKGLPEHKGGMHDGKDGHGMDHKAAVSKMHPEHIHKLVQGAHEGKFGPEAQRMAQQAMQGPAEGGGPPQEEQAPPMASKSSMFAGGDGDQDNEQPMNRASMFGGR